MSDSDNNRDSIVSMATIAGIPTADSDGKIKGTTMSAFGFSQDQALYSIIFSSRYIAECHRERANHEKTQMDRRSGETTQLGHSVYSQVLETGSRREIGAYHSLKVMVRQSVNCTFFSPNSSSSM